MQLGSRIVLATGNPGKIREIADLFADLGVEIVAQSDYDVPSVEETGTTFVDNALLKARNAAACTGLPSIADDSGLRVDALNGKPGVHSARYAGPDASDEENLDLLIESMRAVPQAQRGAAFHCAAVLAFPGDEPAPLVAEADWRGVILTRRRGDGGFGYDPVFFDEIAGKTGAEMRREEKNAVSHRGKAFRLLREQIVAALDGAA